MQYKIFHILAMDAESETVRLNQYLLQNSIHSIDRQFVSDGSNSFWSICVCTLGQPSNHTTSSKRSKVDYQAELSPEHFSLFARLREFRNTIAKEDSIPAYAVFTNEQLAEISKIDTLNMETISQLKGIGGKRLKVHAVRLLQMLENTLGN